MFEPKTASAQAALSRCAIVLAAASLGALAGCTRLPVESDGATCSCASRECGDDGCGDSCGTCSAGQSCVSGACVGCVASCAGRECGEDGCGGLCGTCPSGQACSGGRCICTPSCTGRECGADDCGGSCGTCAGGETCSGGSCSCSSPVICYPDADGDGYYGETPVTACASCPAGTSASPGDDCLDDPASPDAARVNPGVTDFRTDEYCLGTAAECSAGTAATSYDYDCDGTEELERPRRPPACSTGCCTTGSCPGAEPNVDVPCGDAGELLDCCGRVVGTFVQGCR